MPYRISMLILMVILTGCSSIGREHLVECSPHLREDLPRFTFDDQKHRMDLHKDYLAAYIDGWYECMDAFILNNSVWNDREVPPSGVNMPAVFYEGRIAGFTDCQRSLRSAMSDKGVDETALRTLMKTHYASE